MRWIVDPKTGDLVNPAEYYARKAEGVAVSDLPRPTVIGDNIEVRSQVDGKIYTSKAALRASYLPGGNKEGVRYNEVGNEWLANPPKAPTPKVDRKAIRDSVSKARQQVGI